MLTWLEKVPIFTGPCTLGKVPTRKVGLAHVSHRTGAWGPPQWLLRPRVRP